MDATPARPATPPDPFLLRAHHVIRPVRDEAMFLIDLEGRIRSWNEGVSLILGWPEADWLGQPLAVAFTPEDAAAGVPQDEMRNAVLHGRADDNRFMRRRDGTRFFALGAMTRIVDDHGVTVAFLKVLRDLTPLLQAREDLDRRGSDLQRARAALQERNQEIRALVQGVRDYAIFTIDLEGRISSWHPGAELLMGYGVDEALGMPFGQLFTEEDRAAGRPALEMATAAREGEYQGDGERQRKDGSRFEAAAVLTALRSDDGQVLGFLKLTQDITERRAHERERERLLREAQAARAQAEQFSHSKDEFLATISHELRTPLSAILGWANVLERGMLDPETVRHGVGAISRNARVQAQLIEDLLDMNRIESGRLRLELQRIELGGVVAAAIDSALPVASGKGVALRAVFSPGSDVVQGDAARLLQVVSNLLGNAIKFTPAGGQVTVTLARSDQQMRIEVADNGQGIAPEFLSRLFERFQQQDGTPTRRHGGLGIGLAVVRHLVNLHGGSVQARSAGTGQGATFTVCLPLAEGAAVTAEPAPPPVHHAPPHRLDGVVVLVVDDEPDVRSITARLLQEAGAHVLAAASADEALDLMRREHADVLLSDIGMPLVDGHELLRRVRALPPEQGGRIPAAAVTAYGRPEDHARSIAAGYQMHLAKPVAPAQLINAVIELAAQRA